MLKRFIELHDELIEFSTHHDSTLKIPVTPEYVTAIERYKKNVKRNRCSCKVTTDPRAKTI